MASKMIKCGGFLVGYAAWMICRVLLAKRKGATPDAMGLLKRTNWGKDAG